MALPNRMTRLPRVGDGKISFIPNDADHYGWLLLTSTPRMISKTMYPRLFSIYDIKYGGNAQSTDFGLPPAGGRFLLTAGNGHLLGETGGVEDVTLSIDQIPAHSHLETKAKSDPTPIQQGLLTSILNIALQVISKPPTITVSNEQTGLTGGGKSHTNMPPYLTVNVFIFAGLPIGT